VKRDVARIRLRGENKKIVEGAVRSRRGGTSSNSSKKEGKAMKAIYGSEIWQNLEAPKRGKKRKESIF